MTGVVAGLVLAAWFPTTPKVDPLTLPRAQCLAVRGSKLSDATTSAGIAGGFFAVGMAGVASSAITYGLAEGADDEADVAKGPFVAVGAVSAVLAAISYAFLHSAGTDHTEASQIDCPP